MSEINEIIDDLPAGTQSVPKVSVIVPVYKVEKYLPECIESILAQTFTENGMTRINTDFLLGEAVFNRFAEAFYLRSSALSAAKKQKGF